MSVALTGLEEMHAKLGAVRDRYQKAAGQALYEEGLRIQADAMQRCPVDTGRLRATAFTAPPEDKGDGPEVVVGFGTDYAVYVHERTELRHPTGEAKFLENAINEARAGYLERLATSIRAQVGN